ILMIVVLMIATGIAAWFSLLRGIGLSTLSPQVKRGWRWGVAIVLSVWLLVRIALAANPPGVVNATLYTVGLLVFGLVLGILPLMLSPAFRQVVHAIPQTWLVGVHAIRLGGFLFLALMDMKLLPGSFALPAGYGDMIVGLLSLGVVYLLVN